MSNVFKICIANKASAKPILQKSVFAVKNKGIEGDRYFLEKGTWSNKDKPHQQISLIESENNSLLPSTVEKNPNNGMQFIILYTRINV